MEYAFIGFITGSVVGILVGAILMGLLIIGLINQDKEDRDQ